MFSISVMLGSGQFRLLYKTEEAAILAYTALNAGSLPMSTGHQELADDFGQKLFVKAASLHGFLYETTHPCESWSLFVNLVSGFNDSTDHRKIISDMGICSKPKILAALKLIIGTNKAVSSSSRLTTLYNPSSESVWMCSRDSAEASSSIVGDISLQYQVGRQTEQTTLDHICGSAGLDSSKLGSTFSAVFLN